MGAPKLAAIVGPTAVGKSALAVRLATELGGEVVNADSRQVYRRMDVGTAKPTRSQREAVPHHLIDIVDPDEDYSLALFLRQARSAIDEIHGRSRVPIVAGGTGQYVWGLLEGWQVPETPPDAALRRDLEAQVAAEGSAALMPQLRLLDPQAAERVDPLNPRRVVRALEVAMAQGASRARRPRRRTPHWEATIVGLTLSRGELHRRIDDRVEEMIASGWVAEVKELLKAGYDLDLPSMSGLGYVEIARHLDGEISLAEAAAEIKRRTKRFARQQHAWFKRTDERVCWFEATAEGLDAAAQQVTAAVTCHGPRP